MEESNNWLKGLFRKADSYTGAKDTESKDSIPQPPVQIPWSPNVISNLESGITPEEHSMALMAKYSGLGSMERGKAAGKAFNPHDLSNYHIFKSREVNRALKKSKSPKILKPKGIISQTTE